jgi:hypothetical protein
LKRLFLGILFGILACALVGAYIVNYLGLNKINLEFNESIDISAYKDMTRFEARKVRDSSDYIGEFVKEIKDTKDLTDLQAWLPVNQNNWCFECGGGGEFILHFYQNEILLENLSLNFERKSITVFTHAKKSWSRHMTDADVEYFKSLIQ